MSQEAVQPRSTDVRPGVRWEHALLAWSPETPP